jgi:AraC-like DNA-binding protein
MEQPLIIKETALRPTGEWRPDERSWTVMRVVAGAGYLLGKKFTQELNAEDALVIGPDSRVVLRASQLGPLRSEFFTVRPQCFDGLLTVSESLRLKQLAQTSEPQTLFFPGAEPLAQRFKRLVSQRQRSDLALRSALLQFWAATISGLLVEAASPAGGSLQLRERFRELVGQMPAAELATVSLPQLAEKLQCSERHFSRMFHEEFKTSLRSWQTEQRLQQASKLLLSSSHKVANVARESGYQHLGLFNSLFKKRFGSTPSAWREAGRDKAGISAAACLLPWLDWCTETSTVFFSQTSGTLLG